MAKRRYDDSFRASCVVMLEAAGYPNEKGALTRVAKHCGISHQLLKNWATGKENPPPQEILPEKRQELKDLLDAEIRAIFADMPNARPDADYKALGTVLGILMDKNQLLNNQPTERVAIEDGLTDDERATRIAVLLERARARRDGHALAGDRLQ